MLPRNVYDMVVRLREKTEKGELAWIYDDSNSIVSLNLPNFSISLQYNFNLTEEVGEFKIVHTDPNGKDYFFYTSQRYSDYETVRRLFDSAQASGLKFDF